MPQKRHPEAPPRRHGVRYPHPLGFNPNPQTPTTDPLFTPQKPRFARIWLLTPCLPAAGCGRDLVLYGRPRACFGRLEGPGEFCLLRFSEGGCFCVDVVDVGGGGGWFGVDSGGFIANYGGFVVFLACDFEDGVADVIEGLAEGCVRNGLFWGLFGGFELHFEFFGEVGGGGEPVGEGFKLVFDAVEGEIGGPGL